MNYCSNCGTKLDANASFCHNCGARVAAANTGYTTNTVINGQKSKFVAGIVAILLGTLGIHNFYLGYYKKGITQLLMFVFFLGWVSFIWGIVDAIRIFTDKITCDANGVPLADNI
ncbi:MAG: TM2 domain-containing protein [Oscillospiraceae bacterium]|nr:TM2 domain-containing protein [Oscillospiraceae bacterium]MBQ5313772.1 TM2 domain-containing protein [Oscillospiraceae bacterium]MBQ5323848.1 TM2 domain-containing protein [Oscillospiraceae bacterium]